MAKGKRITNDQAERIKDCEWPKHIAVINNRVYRLDKMIDITDQKHLYIEGYEYNLRRVAFFIIHGRWPARQFSLPWEGNQ